MHVARALGIIALVVVVWLAFRLLGDALTLPWPDDWTEALLKLALWVAPCAIALRVWGAADYRAVARDLGLTGSALAGYAFGLAACSPLLVVLLVRAPLRPLSLAAVVSTSLVAPFAEEVLFRGWLCRQLERRARWPLGLAIAVSAVAFGLAHMHTLNWWANGGWDVPTIVSAASAGVLFGWVAWRWNSLWPAIGLHTFLNVSSQIGGLRPPSFRALDFDADATNLARIATIVLAVALTWAQSAALRSARWRRSSVAAPGD